MPDLLNGDELREWLENEIGKTVIGAEAIGRVKGYSDLHDALDSFTVSNSPWSHHESVGWIDITPVWATWKYSGGWEDPVPVNMFDVRTVYTYDDVHVALRLTDTPPPLPRETK